MMTQGRLDFPGEDEELRRVGGRIGQLVLDFCRQSRGRDFHAQDLWNFVSVRGDRTVAPDSPRRILSLLQKQGWLSYVVVDRSQSLYRVMEVKR